MNNPPAVCPHHVAAVGAWRAAYGLPLGRFAAIDCETTGLDPKSDYVLNLGWCVGSIAPDDPGHERFRILDWTRVLDTRALADLSARMERTRRHMEAKGNLYDWTLETLRSGTHPKEVAGEFLADCSGLPLVAHYGWKLDFPIIGRFLHNYGTGLDIAEIDLADSGLLVKAIMNGERPYPGEPYRQFLRRLERARAVGHHSMRTCIDRYGLAAGGATKSAQHDAGYDSWLVYCLYKAILRRAGVSPNEKGAAP